MKKQKVQAKINLEALAGGAFAEKLNEALMQVAENIQNPNTDLEVPQPASDFVFRISEGRGGAPAFKLVAADGGLWKSQAVDNVKNYLVKALADVPDRKKITIIA